MKLVMGGLNKVWLRGLLDESIPYCRRIRAAVAYAQSGHELFDHCKKQGVALEFYGLLDGEGAVSPALLADLLERGASRVTCRLVFGHFHPKVIWWEGFGVYIGSANLTAAAWSKNVECGVFYPEREMESSGIDDEIERMFGYLQEHSVPLSREIVAKLDEIERRGAAARREEREERARFERLFGSIKPHAGLGVVPPEGARVNRRRDEFMREWHETLELLRGLSRRFAAMNLRPRWVAANAHPTVHFDQFLHAYYYKYVRGQQTADEDDDTSAAAKVEQFHQRNRNQTEAALYEAARFWSQLVEAPHGEDVFIADEAPRMRQLFSRESLRRMDRDAFAEAMFTVNAFRMHARQQKNAFFGLPPDHRETIHHRARRLSDWLWDQRSATGRSVRDVLEHVIWSEGTDMEQRLWDCVHDPEWKIEHLGRSTLGEVVGWARPDTYPPRNNRTNKALRALGHAVTLFGD